MINLIINGSKGKMGQTVIACARADKDFSIVGETDLGDDLASIIARSDVLVDFSAHHGTTAIAKMAADNKKALVIGTSGRR